MLEGDFLEVERVAMGIEREAESQRNVERVIGPVATLIAAYTESGDPAAAALVGESFLARSRAWSGDGRKGYGAAIGAMARGGRMPRAEAEVRLLDLFQELAREKQGSLGAWSSTYGWNIWSPDDARAALVAYDRVVPPPDTDWPSISLSWAFMLAGQPNRARAIFDKVGIYCAPVTFSRYVVRQELFDGRLAEQDGNIPSACVHYAKVLERWGHAKPRSVTADEARARSKALGCPAP
jgi:serine/threonine-protein kinase